MVSIIMLTYNAPEFVEHSIETLRKHTKGIPYELIVLDNASGDRTRRLLLKLQKRGMIDKLIFEKNNTYFAKGNNTAARLCSTDSKYILLLNSDVEIREDNWLKDLAARHERGAISYGVCEAEPHVRADGYCFLIDKDLYLRYQLDEQFEWWWSVTKLQAQLLRDSYQVKAVKNHGAQLFHYGGMSGTAWRGSKGMAVEGKEIKAWFDTHEVEIIPSVPGKTASAGDSRFTRLASRRKKRTEQIDALKSMVRKIIRKE